MCGSIRGSGMNDRRRLGAAAVILLFCLAGPLLWRVDPAALGPLAALRPPSLAHPLGTDALGRDALARLMAGGAATLGAAAPACLLAAALGLGYGMASALGPALLDRVLMRLLDAVLALPALVVVLALGALLDAPGLPALALVIGAVAWGPLARLVRNEALAVRYLPYVHAAGLAGAGPLWIARRHILPSVIPALRVNATQLLGDCILLVSTLGFLGLGLPPPRTDWGRLLQEGLALVDLGAWWLIAPPGLLITACLLLAAGGRRP